MVKGGALTGERVEAWRKRLEEQEQLETTRQQAEAGDVKAIERLAWWYREGQMGLAKDGAQWFRWSKLAADKGSVEGMWRTGLHYLRGTTGSAEKCTFRGIHYLDKAAGGGSEHACLLLGWCFDGASMVICR